MSLTRFTFVTYRERALLILKRPPLPRFVGTKTMQVPKAIHGIK